MNNVGIQKMHDVIKNASSVVPKWCIGEVNCPYVIDQDCGLQKCSGELSMEEQYKNCPLRRKGVRAMTDTYLGKPVEINEHGNNAAIKVYLLDDDTMKRNGFRRFISDEDNWWIFCNRVHKDITFNMTIFDRGDWRIDVLDECFCQPYDYQAMYEGGNRMPVVMTVMKNVNEIMDSLVHKGIISGWEKGDYI